VSINNTAAGIQNQLRALPEAEQEAALAKAYCISAGLPMEGWVPHRSDLDEWVDIIVTEHHPDALRVLEGVLDGRL
jgi:hypothetical protein